MRKLIILFLLTSLMMSPVFSQVSEEDIVKDLNITGTFNKKYRGHPKGQTFILKKIQKRTSRGYPPATYLTLNIEGNDFIYPYHNPKNIEFIPHDLQSFWMSVFIKQDMIGYFNKNGFSYSLRNEMTDETADYLNELMGFNLLYQDALVEDYIQKLFSRIAPVGLHPGFPEVRGIYILKSPAPDSYMLPGGTFMITTGLLSILDSEEELMAVLASELVHYVLDHHVMNVRKQMNRVQRAEFWSMISGLMAVAADIYISEKNEDYEPGALTFTAEIISSAVLSRINRRMGMEYTQGQVQAADRIAQRLLTQLELNEAALVTALQKVYDYYEQQKEFYPLSEGAPHASLSRRIASLGETDQFYDKNYKWNISSVTTFNAMSKVISKEYHAAKWFANKNVESGMATDEDYFILSKANLALYDTNESNLESLALIDKSIKMATAPRLDTYKQRLLVAVRLERRIDIKVAINEYLDLLAEYQINVYKPEDLDWCKREINWTNKLKTKYQ